MSRESSTESGGVDVPDDLEAWRNLSGAAICDAMYALKLPRAALPPVVQRRAGGIFVGRARTIDRIGEAGNGTQASVDASLSLGIQEVIDAATPGSVIVIGIGGDVSGATWGGNMAIRASEVGVVAVVTDGAVRDIGQMSKAGLAVYSQAVNPHVNFGHVITRSINKPVVCAGVLVCPDDIVFGDDDGVVIIPARRAEEVLEKARAIQSIEDEMEAFIQQGNTLVDAIKKYKQR